MTELGVFLLGRKAAITVLMWTFLALSVWGMPESGHPGRFDFQNYQFQNDPPIYLDGPWEFFWNQFVSPGTPESKTSLEIPGIWNTSAGVSLPGQGYASFRAKILLPPNPGPLGLKVGNISTGYRLYVNGELSAQVGTPGKSEFSAVAANKPMLVHLGVQKDSLELLFHISNFHHRKGGIRDHLVLGEYGVMERMRESNLILEFILFGSLFIIALYHLGLFVLRRSDRLPLYFSLLCLLVAVRTLLVGERFIIDSLSWVGYEGIQKIEYLTFYLSMTIFSTFMHQVFPREFNTRVLRIFQASGLAFSTLVIVSPIRIYSHTTPFFQLMTFWLCSYVLLVVVRAIIRKRDGGIAFGLGFGVFFITIINDILIQNGFYHSVNLVPAGLFIMIFSQAFLISLRSARSFDHIQALSDHLSKTNTSLLRFVPYEFLQNLKKNSITEIVLGDQVQKNMTILFADIRNFTTHSESLSPRENFLFINSYLSRVSPIIRNHNGFIDKYIGDAIMSLFEKGAENALRAAIAIQRQVRDYSAQMRSMQQPEIRVGIGLHTGELILGTIGAEDRMETTVISDSVNTASRMEGLTKILGTNVIFTGNTLKQIPTPEEFHYRWLGDVIVSGRREGIEIFELIDGLDDEQFDLRMNSRESFENAIRVYQKGQFKEALRLFGEILQNNPSDEPCNYYRSRCQEFLDRGQPKGWIGKEDFSFFK